MSGRTGARTAGRRWLRLAGAATALAVAGLLAFAVVWRIEGGRWERVDTPSMGTVAPVGTLLWVEPVAFDQLRVGDFITFHPPGRAGETYSHRVYRIDPDHTIETKGVIPSPDPWRLSAGDVVGRVAMRWWGMGWLVRAAPVLIVGGLIAGAVLSWLRWSGRARWRLPAAIVLGSLVLTVAITWYRPFVNAQQISFAARPGGGADATYVGTGLLPIRLQAHEGPYVDLRAGQVGTVHVSQADPQHKLRVTLGPAVPFWFWVALVLACFLPALWSLVVGLRPVPG